MDETPLPLLTTNFANSIADFCHHQSRVASVQSECKVLHGEIERLQILLDGKTKEAKNESQSAADILKTMLEQGGKLYRTISRANNEEIIMDVDNAQDINAVTTITNHVTGDRTLDCSDISNTSNTSDTSSTSSYTSKVSDTSNTSNTSSMSSMSSKTSESSKRRKRFDDLESLEDGEISRRTARRQYTGERNRSFRHYSPPPLSIRYIG